MAIAATVELGFSGLLGLLGGHSTASPDVAIVFIVLALLVSFLRYRSHGRGGGRGPFGGGGRGGGYGGGGPYGGGGGGGSRESNPPSDL